MTDTCTRLDFSKSQIHNAALKYNKELNMKNRIVGLVVLGCLLSSNAFAQTSNATLGGTISDASGALIPGVTVTATNAATGIAASVLSNESGAYQFASLQTGSYTVSAELAGF